MPTSIAIRPAASSHHGQVEVSVVVDVGSADSTDVVADSGIGVMATVSAGVDAALGGLVAVSVTCAAWVPCAVWVTCVVWVTGVVDVMGSVRVAVVSSVAGSVVSLGVSV